MQKLRNAIFIVIALIIVAPLVYASEKKDVSSKDNRVENPNGKGRKLFRRDHPRRIRDLIKEADSLQATDTVVVDSVAVVTAVRDSVSNSVENAFSTDSVTVDEEAAPRRPAAAIADAGITVRGKSIGAVIDISANITVTDCPRYRVRFTLRRPSGNILVNKQLSPNEWTSKSHQLVHNETFKDESGERTLKREVSARAYGWLLNGIEMVNSLKCSIEVMDATTGRTLARRDTNTVPFKN